MNKIFMLIAAFALVVAVFGSMSQFRLGEQQYTVFAQDHGGDHDDGGGDADPCCDAPPPPDDAHPDANGGSKEGFEFDRPPLDGAPPVGDATHDLDGGSKDGFDPALNPEGFIDPKSFAGDGGEVLTFEFLEDGSGLALFQGVVFDPSKDLDAMRAAGLFGSGADPVETGIGVPSDAVAGFFDASTGKVFDPNQKPPEEGFDPSSFGNDFITEQFKPGEFQGDFGELFHADSFEKGELDGLFSPDEFKPDDFGSLFDPSEFRAGDFGDFAAVGGEFVDFGDHFDNFFGERGDEAKSATQFFGEFQPGDFQGFAPDVLLEQVRDLDFQGFQELGKDVVFDLFTDGLSGQEFELRGDQWAGAFSQFDVQDIQGLDRGFLEGAVHDFSKEDFLGLPGDQAFALFEGTFFGEAGVGPGGPPADFDPQAFAGKLDEFDAQLGGFMGSFGKDHYEQLGGDLVADMMGKIDFTGLEFDPTVFSGEDVGNAFAAMDFENIQELGTKVFDAVGKFESGDVSRWDPRAAFDVFNSGDFDQVKGLGQIDGLVGAMGPEFLGQVEGDKLVELFDGFQFGGPNFDSRGGALGGQGIVGMMGGMDRSHLDQVGGQGLIDALGYIENLEDLGVMGGDNAFDVLDAVGLGEFQKLPQFDGLVANFGRDQIDSLGAEFGQVLENLDFQNNGALLGGFSFDALDGLFGTAGGGPFGGGDLRVPDHVANLANSVGGGQIFHLHPDKLEGILDSVNPDEFSNFDPSAFSGIFAGLDQDLIAGFDPGKAQAAIEAAGADFLGGSGGFGSIAGGDTAFDLIAGAQGPADSFLSTEWAAIFGGNLFGN